MIFNVPQLGEGLTELKVLSQGVKAGDRIEKDQLLLVVETDKAAMEIESPVAGTIEQWFCNEGDSLPVGSALVSIAVDENNQTSGAETQNQVQGQNNSSMPTGDTPSGTVEDNKKTAAKPAANKAFVPPKTRAYAKKKSVDLASVLENFTGKMLMPDDVDAFINAQHNTSHAPQGPITLSGSSRDIYITTLCATSADNTVTNEQLGLDPQVLQTTGIAARRHISEQQNVFTLAASAVEKALANSGQSIADMDYILCATGTPDVITPSLANQLLNHFLDAPAKKHIAAMDINAACSGWLYALQVAYDFLSNSPNAQVLVVTSETLSEVINPDDDQTRPLFGDGASATILSNRHSLQKPLYKVLRPLLSSYYDGDQAISVPLKRERETYLGLNGQVVFDTAVRGMKSLLLDYCQQHAIAPESLNCLVPHQANQRILDAVKYRLNLPEVKLISNIRERGNTSSSSIPLALAEYEHDFSPFDIIGLTAFGGGFTLGASILQKL